MRLAIVDYRIDKEAREKLEELGYTLILSYNNKNVYPALSGHVDISMFSDGDVMIATPESYDYYKGEIEEKLLGNKVLDNKDLENNKLKLLCGERPLEKTYPKDIAYNLCSTGRYIIGRFKDSDKEVISYLENQSYKKLNIKQGYANCSICQIDENSIITSDKGIEKVLREEGLDVLLIEAGHIDLFEMNYGFIGGCTAKDKDRIFFFGNLDLHPDSKRIREFISSKNKEIICLSKSKLQDYGSAFFFSCE